MDQERPLTRSSSFRQERGREAEDLACRYLKRQGYKILERNLHVKGGEIDILAREGKVLCLVEVRSRHDPGSPYVPEASISPKKLRSIHVAARRLLKQKRLGGVSIRVDLLVLDWKTGDPEIRHHPGGFISLT